MQHLPMIRTIMGRLSDAVAGIAGAQQRCAAGQAGIKELSVHVSLRRVGSIAQAADGAHEAAAHEPSPPHCNGPLGLGEYQEQNVQSTVSTGNQEYLSGFMSTWKSLSKQITCSRLVRISSTRVGS